MRLPAMAGSEIPGIADLPEVIGERSTWLRRESLHAVRKPYLVEAMVKKSDVYKMIDQGPLSPAWSKLTNRYKELGSGSYKPPLTPLLKTYDDLLSKIDKLSSVKDWKKLATSKPEK